MPAFTRLPVTSPLPRRIGRDRSISVVGWTALVTGASSGIGAEFARALAAEGVDLVLTARRVDQLEQLSAEMRLRHPAVSVSVMPADLGEPAAPGRLVDDLTARGLTIDLLINNAGFGSHGLLADADPSVVAAQVQVNCGAVAELSTRLLPGMIARRRGGVINVASTAAFQPVATMAVYAATKAFVLSFSEALWAETRGSGVRVLALCPGGTATEFFTAAGKEFLTRGRQTTAEVVGTGLAAFLRGDVPTVVSGRWNRIMATGYRFVPRALMARTSAKTVRAR